MEKTRHEAGRLRQCNKRHKGGSKSSLKRAQGAGRVAGSGASVSSTTNRSVRQNSTAV